MQAMSQHITQRLAQAAATAPAHQASHSSSGRQARSRRPAAPAATPETPTMQLQIVQDVVTSVLGQTPDPEQPLMQACPCCWPPSDLCTSSRPLSSCLACAGGLAHVCTGCTLLACRLMQYGTGSAAQALLRMLMPEVLQ